jgi:Flp pilus assembly protein protease CpaA
LYIFRVASLIVIALLYMLFDVFNRRNVPDMFAYLTVAYGFVLTVLYFNLQLIIESTAISFIVIGIGYVLYRIGQLGAADVIEFAALSLILPVLQFPALISRAQFGVPFVFSLLVNTGIVALIIVPLYYIPKAKAKLKKPLLSFVNRRNLALAAGLMVAYVAFILFTIYEVGLDYIGVIILVLMMVSSFFVMLLSVPVTYSMVEYVGVDKFDEGDIIATNLMSSREIASIKRKVKGFSRLMTKDIIKEMKKKKVKDRLPAYKNAMPFALPIFVAVIITVLFGNLIFFILSI